MNTLSADEISHASKKLIENTARQASGCLEWQGLLNEKGYGRLCVSGFARKAHRVAWIVSNGPIPGRASVLHRCDNPKCVNPKHLFLGTQADNIADMVAKGRVTHGERNSQAKLTENIVRKIVASPLSRRATAVALNISYYCVCDVLSGRSWSHFTGIRSCAAKKKA